MLQLLAMVVCKKPKQQMEFKRVSVAMARDGAFSDDPKKSEEQKTVSDIKCQRCGSLGGPLSSVKRFGVYQHFCSPCTDMYISCFCCPHCLLQIKKDAANEYLLLVCHICQRSVHRDCELQRFPDKTLTALYACFLCEEKIRVVANEENLGHSDKKPCVDGGGCLVAASEDAGQLRQISSNIPAGKVAPALSSAATSVANAKAMAMNAVSVAAAAKATAIEKAVLSAKAAAAAKAALEAASLAARAAAQVQAQLHRELLQLEAAAHTVAKEAEKKLDSEIAKQENNKNSK